MSRPARAGSAGKPVTIRATDAERERWERVAAVAEMSLSEWVRRQLNAHVAAFNHRFGIKAPSAVETPMETRPDRRVVSVKYPTRNRRRATHVRD